MTDTQNDKDFWLVTKDASWDRDNNVEHCRVRFLLALKSHGLEYAQYRKRFNELKEQINEETKRRTFAEEAVFIDRIEPGGDDFHYMDFPAHLISRGQEKVEKYLAGGRADFRPIECFSYIFQA